jgi:hypothetical protein
VVALGHCVDCSRPVCRAHSVFAGDDLVCDKDLTARKAQQKQDRVDAYMAAVEAMDARTSKAVSVFLEAASGVEPERITMSKEKVQVTVPGAKRLFGRGPDQVVEKWEYEHSPGYRIFSWVYRDHGDPPDEESQHLYVLKSGELILEGGYEGFDAWWPFGRKETGTGGYIRGVGVLPGFLSRSPTARPLTPGLPDPPETAVLARSAEWLEERLTEFLANQAD